MNDQDNDFYNSAAAAKMADEYAKQLGVPLATRPNVPLQAANLLTDATAIEKQIEQTRFIFMRRRRARLEVKLQRTLLQVLVSLSPADQQLGRETYARLLSCVDRLEKLC